VLLLFFVSPCPAWPGQGETFVVSLGLSSYRPSLKEVRQTLKDAGGGKLAAQGDYRGERLYVSAGFARPGPHAQLRELSYCRYRALAASGDYLVEIEKFSGAVARPFKGQTQAKLQAYWGGGVELIRMKREGSLEERGAHLLTQKDWLWGLCAFAGLAYDLSAHLALNLRYCRDIVPASTFGGAKYQLGGQSLVYSLALRF
jgi:opacity protein-like surface antigen